MSDLTRPDWVEAMVQSGYRLRPELVKGGRYVCFDPSSLTWGVRDLDTGSTSLVGSKKQAMLAAGFSELESTLETEFCGFDARKDGIRRELRSLEVGGDFVELLEKLEEPCD